MNIEISPPWGKWLITYSAAMVENQESHEKLIQVVLTFNSGDAIGFVLDEKAGRAIMDDLSKKLSDIEVPKLTLNRTQRRHPK